MTEEFIELLRHLGTKWYQCPNGHAYTIGECGLPMEESKCPECGEKIGGRDHVPLTTNKMVDFEKDVKDNINGIEDLKSEDNKKKNENNKENKEEEEKIIKKEEDNIEKKEEKIIEKEKNNDKQKEEENIVKKEEMIIEKKDDNNCQNNENNKDK